MSDETVTEIESRRLAQRLGARLRLSQRYKPAIAKNVHRFGASIRLLPLLLRKPRLFLLWLLSARRAQFFSVAAILLLTLVIPPTFSKLADVIYPPITIEQRVLIVLKRNQTFAHPSR